jgi:hypothetical protein
MIVVTIDLCRASGGVKRLGQIHIWNDGTSNAPQIGHYGSRFFGANGRLLRRLGIVKNWPRKRKTVFSLLREILQKAGY